MAKFLKKFQDNAQYEAYTASTVFVRHNVSLIVTDGSIHYDPTSKTYRIIYYANEKLNLDETKFVPQPTAHTFADGVGVLEFDGPVTKIGEETFTNQTGLTDIFLPDTIEEIGDRAFSGCTGLTGFTCEPEEPPTLGEDVFDGVPSGFEINVPSDSVDDYQNAPGWSDYSDKINPIVKVESVSVSPTTVTLNVGATTALTATVLPADADNKNVVWSSSNPAIATVNANGVVTAVAEGNCVITVTTLDGGKTAQCAATIESATVHVTGVTVSPTVMTINVGETSAVTATVLPADATDKSVTWTSSNPSVATVDANGNVTAIAEGNANITVRTTDGNYTAQCAATVEAQPQPTTELTYTASSKLDVEPTRFTPTAISETYDAVTQTGVIGFNAPVTGIGDFAFYQKNALTSIDIPDSVIGIGEQVFYQCTSLTSVTIPDSVTYIGVDAFYGCSSLTSIDIPSGVTFIGYQAFNYCNSLQSITCEATTPPSLGEYVFDGSTCPIYVPCESVNSYKSAWSAYASRIQCVTPPAPTTAITYTASSKLDVDTTKFTPAATAETYDSATQTGVIEFNAPVTEIGDRAFMMNQNLITIELPNSITTIGVVAFQNCWSLTSIDIPSGVTSIGQQAFQNCTSLTSITCEATTPPTLGSMAFDATNNCPIYVPCASVDTYKSATIWSYYSSRIQCATPSHEYVDLGLPSGTKWATMNVGATSETDYGNYYQYGKGADDYFVTSGQSTYSGTENPLAANADTATQVWGSEWHMPTQAQLNELTANTTYTWETNFNGSGINGGKFTASNGNYVFFPAAGTWSNGARSGVGMFSSYWSSSNPSISGRAYSLNLSDGGKYVNHYSRDYGYSVRPVVG